MKCRHFISALNLLPCRSGGRKIQSSGSNRWAAFTQVKYNYDGTQKDLPISVIHIWSDPPQGCIKISHAIGIIHWKMYHESRFMMLLHNFDCSMQKSEKVTTKHNCERARLQSRINIKIVKVKRSNRCEILRGGKNNNDPDPPRFVSQPLFWKQ